MGRSTYQTLESGMENIADEEEAFELNLKNILNVFGIDSNSLVISFYKLKDGKHIICPIGKYNPIIFEDMTEIINNYVELIPKYEKSRNGYRKELEEISLLKVYSENDERNIKLFKDKMSEKFRKNSSLVKT